MFFDLCPAVGFYLLCHLCNGLSNFDLLTTLMDVDHVPSVKFRSDISFSFFSLHKKEGAFKINDFLDA